MGLPASSTRHQLIPAVIIEALKVTTISAEVPELTAIDQNSTTFPAPEFFLAINVAELPPTVRVLTLLSPLVARPPPTAITMVRLLAASPRDEDENVYAVEVDPFVDEPRCETLGFVEEILLLPNKPDASNFK